VALYDLERETGESATAFFGRVELARVKKVLSDLEDMSEESAAGDDFIDLGEEAEFHPETQAGECAA